MPHTEFTFFSRQSHTLIHGVSGHVGFVMSMDFIDSLKERDPAKASKFAELTLDDLRTRLLAIQDHIAVNDYPKISEKAHAMKSVAAQAGASGFSELCRLIELCCEGQGDKALAELFLDLQSEFHKVEQKLHKYME